MALANICFVRLIIAIAITIAIAIAITTLTTITITITMSHFCQAFYAGLHAKPEKYSRSLPFLSCCLLSPVCSLVSAVRPPSRKSFVNLSFPWFY
jgi:hypothetical protein